MVGVCRSSPTLSPWPALDFLWPRKGRGREGLWAGQSAITLGTRGRTLSWYLWPLPINRSPLYTIGPFTLGARWVGPPGACPGQVYTIDPSNPSGHPCIYRSGRAHLRRLWCRFDVRPPLKVPPLMLSRDRKEGYETRMCGPKWKRGVQNGVNGAGTCIRI